MQITYSPHFERAYRKLRIAIQRKAERKEQLFRENPFEPSLNTHKLSGKLGEFWSFSIDRSHRIIFEFGNQGMVYFHAVGNHDVYE